MNSGEEGGSGSEWNDSASAVGSVSVADLDLSKSMWRGGIAGGVERESAKITTPKKKKSTTFFKKRMSGLAEGIPGVRGSRKSRLDLRKLSDGSMSVKFGTARAEMIIGGFHIINTQLKKDRDEAMEGGGSGRVEEGGGTGSTDYTADNIADSNVSVRVTKFLKFDIKGHLSRAAYKTVVSDAQLNRDFLEVSKRSERAFGRRAYSR